MPGLGPERQLSKYETLQMAQSYISELTELLKPDLAYKLESWNMYYYYFLKINKCDLILNMLQLFHLSTTCTYKSIINHVLITLIPWTNYL